MACEMLLKHAGEDVALPAPKMRELPLDHVALIQLIHDSGSTVKGCHIQIVNGEIPNRQGATNWSNAGIVSPKAITVDAQGLLFLSLGIQLNVPDALLPIFGAVKGVIVSHHHLDLVFQILQLRFLCFVDLSSSQP